MLEIPRPVPIVEVGAFKGLSTCLLASVTKAVSPKTVVFSFDPLDGIVSQRRNGTTQTVKTSEGRVQALRVLPDKYFVRR